MKRALLDADIGAFCQTLLQIVSQHAGCGYVLGVLVRNRNVEGFFDGHQELDAIKTHIVSGGPYDGGFGSSENSFARWTHSPLGASC